MCNLCRQTPCNSQCPNYIPPRAKLHCSICDNGIYEGEEYIENDDGEYRHYECFQGMRELLQWLGYEIKTMEDDNYD